MSRKINMKDVAAEAGVSTATVGRVIHNRGYVSSEARARVESAIARTGFSLNMVAQSLRRDRSMTIGHLLTSIMPNPFFAQIELGVEQEAIKNGYNVLIWNVLGDARREREGVEMFIQRRLDAIIFTTPRDKANIKLALNAGIPVVQVERVNDADTHKVLVDNYAGAASAVEHLIALGHRQIGFIGKKYLPAWGAAQVDNQRYLGYADVLKRNGITPEPTWFAEADLYSIDDGYRGANQLLEANPTLTALLAACDITAAGVLQALYELRLRVPDDISVIGFDDTYASYLSPPLTTVEQPMHEIGRVAAQLAIQAVDSREDSFPQVRVSKLATRLCVRASTGPAPIR